MCKSYHFFFVDWLQRELFLPLLSNSPPNLWIPNTKVTNHQFQKVKSNHNHQELFLVKKTNNKEKEEVEEEAEVDLEEEVVVDLEVEVVVPEVEEDLEDQELNNLKTNNKKSVFELNSFEKNLYLFNWILPTPFWN